MRVIGTEQPAQAADRTDEACDRLNGDRAVRGSRNTKDGPRLVARERFYATPHRSGDCRCECEPCRDLEFGQKETINPPAARC